MMRRLFKIIGITLLTLGIFYVYNAGCIDFIRWYTSLQLLPQLFVGFAFGGISWLMGKAINLFLLSWVNQQPTLTIYGLALLASLWFLHSLILFSTFSISFKGFTWPAISSMVLAAELSIFPMIA